MDSDRPRSSTFQIIPGVAALVLFGVFFQTSFVALAARLPKQVFFEPSFTIALLRQSPIGSGLGIAAVVFVLWLFSPYGRESFKWHQIDRSGGLKWPILFVGMAFAWAYAGHRYNFYYDQSHVWDRWLIIALMLGMLRSPLLIPLFVFEVLLSQAQFNHPLASRMAIGDELPLRVLGIVFGCAVWNGGLDQLTAFRSSERTRRFEKWLVPARIRSHAVVFSILCMIGFYYSVAGIGKMMLGENIFEWMRFSHMENLLIASYLNGWLGGVSEARMLAAAEVLRVLHLPITVLTLIIELGMALILVRRRGSLLILAAVSAMHLGIVMTSGIVFWKWLVLDLSLLVWLWTKRGDVELGQMYSRSNALLSLVVIAGLIGFFSLNLFSWWNTKWTMLYEVEVLDEAGNIYPVSPADFAPYTFFDLYKPTNRRRHTYVIGMSVDRKLMEFFENADVERLEKFAGGSSAQRVGPVSGRGNRIFGDFMTRYFTHRNQHPRQTVPPFVLSPPSMHNRFLIGPDLYRDQSPVVEARLRFKEIYYTRSGLRSMTDEIVYSVPIGIPKRPE